jgi:methionyl-tRNA formyltransferase
MVCSYGACTMEPRMKIERIVFFGTAPIAIPSLLALHADPASKVVAVCTQPDRPKGRKRQLAPSPVKEVAMELGLPVLDPPAIADVREALTALAPDLGVVFAYGQYLPSAVFDLPSAGSVNFHPSLLPRYRGASPIQTAIARGDAETGLSLIRVGKAMDAGDVMRQERCAITPEDNSLTLHDRFARMAGDWVPDLLEAFRTDTVRWSPQDPDGVVECGRLTKQDGAVDWTLPARTLHNRLRAFVPWPGCFFAVAGLGAVKIHAASVSGAQGQPGEILAADAAGIVVGCGEEALCLTELQPPGKKSMTAESFLNGYDWKVGDRLPEHVDVA